MTIVIKEIQVKTTIERINKSPGNPENTEELLRKMKRERQKETVKLIKEQNKSRKER
ncbi:MAG: hypothetical protein LBF85_07295 [Tannerella sp.]|jgi:hypothetical protein|nr:hypothetical protein [Tannerella sp.]